MYANILPVLRAKGGGEGVMRDFIKSIVNALFALAVAYILGVWFGHGFMHSVEIGLREMIMEVAND